MSVRARRKAVLAALDGEGIRRLVEQADNNTHVPAEARLFLRLLFLTGARVSELIPLRRGDFRKEDGRWIVQLPTLKNKDRGSRMVPFPSKVAPEIEELDGWLAGPVVAHLASLQPEDKVFPRYFRPRPSFRGEENIPNNSDLEREVTVERDIWSRRGRRWVWADLSALVVKGEAWKGKEKIQDYTAHFWPHFARRCRLTLLGRFIDKPTLLSVYAGHANLSATSAYLHPQDKDVLSAF